MIKIPISTPFSWSFLGAPIAVHPGVYLFSKTRGKMWGRLELAALSHNPWLLCCPNPRFDYEAQPFSSIIEIHIISFLFRFLKAQLASLLTAREISKLESFFKVYDPESNGKISLSEAKFAYLKWFLSLIKRAKSAIVPLSWTGELPAGWHENAPASPAVSKTKAQITWKMFLRMNALHVVSARPNTVETRPYAPTVDEAIHVQPEDADEGLRMRIVKQSEEDLTEVTDPIARIKMRLKNK